MNSDIDVRGDNEADEAPAAAAACTLPVLGNIWECPKIRKFVTTDDSGKEFTGWSCGWCMKRNDVPFRGLNASKALWHVLKEAGQTLGPVEAIFYTIILLSKLRRRTRVCAKILL